MRSIADPHVLQVNSKSHPFDCTQGRLCRKLRDKGGVTACFPETLIEFCGLMSYKLPVPIFLNPDV
jgi:hypothetical protein